MSKRIDQRPGILTPPLRGFRSKALMETKGNKGKHGENLSMALNQRSNGYCVEIGNSIFKPTSKNKSKNKEYQPKTTHTHTQTQIQRGAHDCLRISQAVDAGHADPGEAQAIREAVLVLVVHPDRVQGVPRGMSNTMGSESRGVSKETKQRGDRGPLAQSLNSSKQKRLSGNRQTFG